MIQRGRRTTSSKRGSVYFLGSCSCGCGCSWNGASTAHSHSPIKSACSGPGCVYITSWDSVSAGVLSDDFWEASGPSFGILNVPIYALVKFPVPLCCYWPKKIFNQQQDVIVLQKRKKLNFGFIRPHLDKSCPNYEKKSGLHLKHLAMMHYEHTYLLTCAAWVITCKVLKW